MEFVKTKNMVKMMRAFLGLTTLPIKDSALDFTQEQKAELQKAFGEKIAVDDVLAMVNKEISALEKDTLEEDQDLIDAREKIKQEMQAHGLSQEDIDAASKDPKGQKLEGVEQIMAMFTAYTKEVDTKLAKLAGAPELNTPIAQNTTEKNLNMKHSSTHLFGSDILADSFEGRNWNKRLAGKSSKPTDWASEGKVEIQQLKGDIDAYYRAFPDEIKSLHRDLTGLPAHWRVLSNVTDSAGDASIVSGPITQARKLPWLAKNNQSIKAEKGKVFPVHIDIEFAGYRLQEIENNFIGDIYNKEGSQPLKYVFVRFLLKELDKQARLEDRIVATKGVYVATPESATIPGMYINRGDGLFIILWRAYHILKQYAVALIGKPTPENIVDYVTLMIEKNLKEDIKNTQGLYFYLSPSWLRKYKERKRIIYGQDNNYDGSELVAIENYENIKFHALRDMEGSDFMFITTEDNIQPMENLPKEKSMYNFDSLKRMLFVFADYKWGIRLKHIGNKTKEGDPLEFKKQTVWTNGLSPFAKDFTVRLYDDGTSEIALPYSNITITDDFTSEIETLTNTYPGQIVRIKGNTAVAASAKVTDDGNITLTSNTDFSLSTGGTLTLRVADNGNLTEIKRTTEPDVASASNVKFSGTSIDSEDGFVFDYTGGAATMTGILNGYEGQEIVINGGAGGALTLSDVAGNIEVTSDAVLANGSDNITLTLIDDVWTEVARTIA